MTSSGNSSAPGSSSPLPRAAHRPLPGERPRPGRRRPRRNRPDHSPPSRARPGKRQSGDLSAPGLALLGFLCLGLVLLFCGLARTRRGKRCRKYLSLIGKRSSVSIDALARTTGTRRRKVLDDLQDMLDDGLLPTGYLDLAHARLVLSEEGIPDEAPPEKPPAAEPQAPQDDNAIL